MENGKIFGVLKGGIDAERQSFFFSWTKSFLIEELTVHVPFSALFSVARGMNKRWKVRQSLTRKEILGKVLIK